MQWAEEMCETYWDIFTVDLCGLKKWERIFGCLNYYFYG